eukprot:m.975447 g.975447  ORF g.975447 m.975447 type:complete len:61 (-) comp23940_c0_seq1:7-189(-)
MERCRAELTPQVVSFQHLPFAFVSGPAWLHQYPSVSQSHSIIAMGFQGRKTFRARCHGIW